MMDGYWLGKWDVQWERWDAPKSISKWMERRKWAICCGFHQTWPSWCFHGCYANCTRHWTYLETLNIIYNILTYLPPTSMHDAIAYKLRFTFWYIIRKNDKGKKEEERKAIDAWPFMVPSFHTLLYALYPNTVLSLISARTSADSKKKKKRNFWERTK